MFHSIGTKHESSFRRLGFTQRVWRCTERATSKGEALERGEIEELLSAIDGLRDEMLLCSSDVIRTILEHNPGVIRVVRASADESSGTCAASAGILALLPLNGEGVQAICEGRFEGMSPSTAWICREGEQPEALYVWLLFMPGRFGGLLGSVAATIDDMAAQPCPLFSRAINDHSARLQRLAGFVPARQFYPGCAEHLQVVFPERPLPAASNRIEVRIARTIEDIARVFAVRSATYIAEQFCLYAEEFDGNDFCSTQFLGTVDGDPAGCVRLRFFNGFAKLERLAVRREYRTSRLAYRMVREALEHCRLKGYTKIYGHSRYDLVRFWRVFGFRPIEARPDFAFANVRYVEILAELEPHAGAVRLGADPMLMIRPEGAWNQPGPFDLSLSSADPRRKGLLEETVRTIRHQSVSA